MNRLSRILNGASLAGIASFAMFLLYYYVLGLNPIGPIKYVGLVIPVLFFTLTLKKYREIELNGHMKFKEAIPAVSLFTFVYASLAAMLMYFFGLLVDDGFLDLYKSENLKQLGLTKDMFIEYVGKDMYQEMIDQIEMQTVGSLSLGDFWSKLIGAFVICLIIAGILRKNPPPSEVTYE